jgi:hypothetical protein
MIVFRAWLNIKSLYLQEKVGRARQLFVVA